MEITSKEKLITFAMIGLCAVIGVMSFLAVVYYGQASGMNSQTGHLQSTIDQLQADKAQLETDKVNLEDQIATLTKQNQNLTLTVNHLTALIESTVGMPEPKATRAESIISQRPINMDPARLPKDTSIIR